MKLVSVRPSTQLHWDAAPTDEALRGPEVTVIGDATGRLKAWFDTHPVGFVVVRPDRYVAAAALAQDASRVTAALATALHLTEPLPIAAELPTPATAFAATAGARSRRPLT